MKIQRIPSLFAYIFFLLLSSVTIAQVNQTAVAEYPLACVAPSSETAGLDFTADDSYLRFVEPSNDAYLEIDGNRMKQLVVDQAEIAHRYRNAGNQFWGRIIGTKSDHDTALWMMEQLNQSGVENVRQDPIVLPPQWIPERWVVSATKGRKSVELTSAWPAYGSLGTGLEGLELELVDVGLGLATDFIGRNVAGKAVVVHSIPTSGTIINSAARSGAIRRADELGAAAILVVLELPGNLQTAFYDVGTNVPTLSIGSADGAALQQLLTDSSNNNSVKVDVQLEVNMVEGLTTSSVRGEVPASSADAERIVIVAHRDAYFEGASDNASGVATALELMRYFAQVPESQRIRTIEIIGTPGHHNLARTGHNWLFENRESILDQTVLLINAEHSAHALIDRWGNELCSTNSIGPFSWRINGSGKLTATTLQAFDEFGIPRWTETGGPAGEIRTISNLVPSVVLMHAGVLLHTNIETAEAIPAVSLAATTRAFAKIIDQANGMSFEDLSRRSR